MLFMVAKKDSRKLNCYELICAMCLWALNIKELSIADYRALLKHISFILKRAKHSDLIDMAHVEYDLAICIMAEDMGFAAFYRSNQGSSVIHYGAQNMHTKKPTVGTPFNSMKKGGGSAAKRALCMEWGTRVFMLRGTMSVHTCLLQVRGEGP